MGVRVGSDLSGSTAGGLLGSGGLAFDPLVHFGTARIRDGLGQVGDIQLQNVVIDIGAASIDNTSDPDKIVVFALVDSCVDSCQSDLLDNTATLVDILLSLDSTSLVPE